jgi:hypothetical protein
MGWGDDARAWPPRAVCPRPVIAHFSRRGTRQLPEFVGPPAQGALYRRVFKPRSGPREPSRRALRQRHDRAIVINDIMQGGATMLGRGFVVWRGFAFGEH